MSRPVKIIAGIGIVLVAVLIAIVVLAKILVTPERVRTTVLPLAEKHLQRPVQLGDIEISLLSGITLHDLVVGEAEGKEEFVRADRAVLRYRLWPLLFMRVVIDEARLEGPRIRVVRLDDGRFNFSDLMEQGKKEGEEEPAKSQSPGRSIDLLVSEVAIEGGELIFLDHAVGREPPYRFKVSAFRATASGISLERPFSFETGGNLGAANFQAEGEANLAEPGGFADIVLSGFDFAPFSPYYREAFPGTLRSLTVDAELRAEGNGRQARSEGTIRLSGIDLVLDALKDAPLQGAKMTLDYRVDADLEKAELVLGKTTATFNGLPVTLSGRVENYAAEPTVDLEVLLDGLELRSLMRAAPPSLVEPARPLDPAGRIDARFHLAGTVAKPRELLREGRIDLLGIKATVTGLRPTLEGGLEIAGDSLASKDLHLVEGENRADLELRAENLFGEPIVVNTSVKAERFALDPILAASAAPAAAAGDAQTAETGGQAKEEVGPLDLPLKVDGSVTIGQTLYKGLSIDDFVLNYRLRENVLTIDRLTGKVAGGGFSQTARVDLTIAGLDYRTDLSLDGIRADPFVTAFLPKASGTVFGSLDLEGRFNGRGTVPETMKKNLSGQGSFLLRDGKITGAGLVQGLAAYLDLEELRILRFSKAAGDFSVDRGKVKIDGDFSGSDVRMTPKGSVGLDGSVDLALNARLSPELTARLDSGGAVSKYLTDDEGWGQLPLKVAGSWNSPRFTLDTSLVRKKAEEEVKKRLQEKVLEKLAPEEGEEQEPAKKLLDETLQGLFGN